MRGLRSFDYGMQDHEYTHYHLRVSFPAHAIFSFTASQVIPWGFQMPEVHYDVHDTPQNKDTDYAHTHTQTHTHVMHHPSCSFPQVPVAGAFPFTPVASQQ
ncbi:unnamed protein product [Sphacelaria rigidula]